MGLETYRKKRRFGRTPEPEGTRDRHGGAAESSGGRFVVQKHAASRLHFDFRLEMDGVLKSWAVPKGPSLDPSERRLAIHVEDHPLEYADFEGVIPEGEYGGGAVMLWDRGRWASQGGATKGYERGHLKFILGGEVLRGGWVLVRMKGEAGRKKKENWLLIKEEDEEARAGDGAGVVRREQRSAESGRTMKEIAAARDRVWSSRGGPDASTLAGAVRRALPFPRALRPELATLVDVVPEGEEWLHEIKFDGYRVLARVDGGGVKLMTRGGKDWTSRMRPVAEVLKGLAAKSAVLDGEVVVLDALGVSDFQKLQNALDGQDQSLVYEVFDLRHLDGWDLERVALVERKRALEALLDRSELSAERVRYSDHVVGRGRSFFERACSMGLEGVVSKRAESVYRAARTREWVKTKCLRRQEFIVVGYSEPSGSRVGLGALLIGYHEDGALRSAGRVGTGFTDARLRDLAERLRPLERARAPVEDPPRGAAARGVHWVEPKLVVEVAFTEWTKDGSLRHPSFKGLREDKGAADVVRERPVDGEAQVERSGAASAGAARQAAVRVGRARVKLTHADRVLYRGQGLTKRDLAEYYVDVGAAMLPHLAGRPLSIVRCPDGTDAECFYQKHARAGVPEAIGRVEIEEQSKRATYLHVETLDALVSLVQIGVLEIHAWGARIDRLERPDRIVIDLDPGAGVEWPEVVEAAVAMRDRFTALGLRSFVKTTGGKGLHVVVPLVRRSGWDEVKAFSRAIAVAAAAERPDRYVARAAKKERRGRIYIDYLRNARGATAVAPYSTRAREGAPVSTPVSWEELQAGLDPHAFTVATVPERLRSRRAAAWTGFDDTRQSITKSMMKEVGVR